MNIDFDPIQRKLVNGPEAGANVEVDGFTVSVIGGGTGTETLYNAGTGIGIEGSTITNTMAGSGRIAIDGGTASFIPSADIVNVTGTSVTLQPDTAYKIYATSQAITLNANPPSAGKWAYDGHLEIFTAGTGYIVTGTNVVLANALEPDAVNNCTVRFHDGIAIIAVEDHVAGYIVVNGSTSGDGSLAYGITTSTNDYVAFDASLNGTTIPLAGAVAEGEKHLVGNGYTETAITGAVDCGTSKFTVANLGLNNVQVTGGVMTFGDAYIPSGSTVAVSGGRLAIEKVTGAGSESVIDLGGTNLLSPGRIDSVTISGGSAVTATTGYGGAIYIADNKVTSISNVSFTGNNASGSEYNMGNAVFVRHGAKLIASNCFFDARETVCVYRYSTPSYTQLEIRGTFKTLSQVNKGPSGVGANVYVSSGAIIDLTGNTIATPIAPDGGITFASGGATVLYSSGAVSGSYMMDNVTLPAGAKLTNTAVVDLGGKNVVVSQTNVGISGCSIKGGTANVNGGAFLFVSTPHVEITSSIISGNSCAITNGGNGGGFLVASATAVVSLSGSTVTGNRTITGRGGGVAATAGSVLSATSSVISGNYAGNASAADDIYVNSATAKILGACEVGKCYLTSGGGIEFSGSNTVNEIVTTSPAYPGTVTISSGAILDLTGNTNATPINPGGGVTFAPGGAIIYPSAGSASAYMLGGMTVPKIGNTNVVNLGGTNVLVSSGGTAYASGCTITGGSENVGGGLNISGSVYLSRTTITGNTANTNGGAFYLRQNGYLEASSCTFSGNAASTHGPDGFARYGVAKLIDCNIGEVSVGEGSIELVGSCAVDKINSPSGQFGIVTLTSGAIIDLTGNTNATPINPGGGVTVLGGCQVITSAGSTVSIAGGTYTKINNDGTTE